MSNRKNGKRIAYICLILILVLVMLYSGLRILESTVFAPQSENTVPTKTITRNGIDYFPRQDITVVMVLGIDKFGPVQASESYNNDGAADMVLLLIFDETNKELSILALNRDTMLEMPVLGLGGKYAGTYYGQLALSHTYGSGLADSCENTRQTVSDFLYGINIDHYVSMHMDAISLLNDAVGGVTVNIKDDFSAIDPTMPKGVITLKGKQAINFVRSRAAVGNQLNVSRMERQETYMSGFLSALREQLSSNDSFALSVVDQISPYLVTDCSATTISGMMDRYADYSLKQIVSPEGENMMGEKYYEFHVNEEKLDELILQLFYAPKK